MYCTTPSGTRYQTGCPSRDPLPAGARGDRHRRHVEQGHRVIGQVRVGQLVAGPGDADEMGQLEHLLGVLPGQDLPERVGAGDEVQLGVGT